MNDAESPAAPLVVLCGHRSGSSAFMALMADVGLHLGDLLLSAPDNPKGFFENRDVVETNRRLLCDRDRDWTCPPPSLDHRTVDLEPLTLIGDELRSGRRPWGFKDPRTLFTLPAWAAAVGACRLAGVHRNSADIARSLAARSDLTLEEATAIALAYAERLAEAHQRLLFPIVSFDAERDVFLERTALVAAALGLDWDPALAASRYEPSLVHHRSTDDTAHPVDVYLAKAGRLEFDSMRVYTPATIVRTWDDLPSDLTDCLPTNVGPRHQLRRVEMLRWSADRLPETSSVVVVEAKERPVRLRNSLTMSLTPTQLRAAPDRGEAPDHRWSHVVAPSLLDDVNPSELGAILDAISGRLETRALIAVGGWVLESGDLPTAHTFQPAGIRAFRTKPPYLHHIDEITSTLLGRGLYVSNVQSTPGGRTHLFLTNDQSLQGDAISPFQLRLELAGMDQLRQELAEMDQLRQELAEMDQLRLELAGMEQTVIDLKETLAGTRANADRAQKGLVNSEREFSQLREQVVALELEHKRAMATVRQRLAKAEKASASAQRSYQRLARRRIVRLALAISRPMRPVFRFVRSLPEKPARVAPATIPSPPHVRRSRQELVEGMIRSRTAETSTSGPKVSMVILTKDGAHHLAQLLPALDSTVYRSFEVIVIDNGSVDGTPDLLARNWSFPITVVHNNHNTSFSAGNNQGAERATGELLLFLNNDVEPIDPGWLGSMVSALESQKERVAAGAMLVYPDRGDPDTDLTVQHVGIELGLREGAPHAWNISKPDPLDPGVVGTWEVPAATAAVLMVRREAFDQVGGFDPGYVYGAEDVDLCLKLGRHGSIVVVGDAALFHYESASQRAERGELTRINRIGNWRLFAERWGPTLTRSLAKDRVSGASRLSGDEPRTVAITLTHDDEKRGWGDYYTAHELGDAFAAEGWRVVYAERHRDQWHEIEGHIDLVISLLDAYDVRRAPAGVYTIAWVRNWVDRWVDRPWFESFDLVVTSSHRAAGVVADRTRFQPAVVPLATNPERFAPGPPVPTFEADYAFSGNNWGAGRDLVPMLDVRPNERFLVFGKGWDSEPRMARNWRGHLDYDLLPDLYRSVRIVLDDTAGPTLPHAFLNGRVFDALAAGALVITDNVEGSAEMFDGALPTYSNRAELRSQLDTFLSDDELRQKTVDRLRTRVLEEHTYDKLPSRFVEAALGALDCPKVAFKIGVPNADQIEHWGDTHFARSMGHALSKQGFQPEVHILPEWERLDRQDCDVVIHLRGLTTYTPKPAHLNVLWLISHPDDLSPGECDKYDLVLVASKSHADRLANQTAVPVVFMPQATDGRRFRPMEPDPELAEELLFVGNSRKQMRPGVAWALDRGLPLAVYGQDWQGIIPPRVVRSEHFPNERLASLYASAKVVLNDHWPDMRDRGFISNRIFDVLASGGVVVSDPVEGLSEMFGDLVHTYRSPEELERLVRDLLNDPDRRATLRAKGAGLVATEHTFERRAEQLAGLLRPMLAQRPMDLNGHTFDGEGEYPLLAGVKHSAW